MAEHNWTWVLIKNGARENQAWSLLVRRKYLYLDFTPVLILGERGVIFCCCWKCVSFVTIFFSCWNFFVVLVDFFSGKKKQLCVICDFHWRDFFSPDLRGVVLIFLCFFKRKMKLWLVSMCPMKKDVWKMKMNLWCSRETVDYGMTCFCSFFLPWGLR